MKPIGEYAEGVVKTRLLYLHPMTMIFLCDVIQWAESKGLPVKITDAVSTRDEDKELDRLSATHREGRAFDISTKDWPRDLIDECRMVFFAKYRLLAAIGEGGEPRPIVYHDSGHGFHIHCQLGRKFALPVREF
jgi:hypothetical protein